MNNSTLDQKLFSDSAEAAGTTTKLQKKPHTAIPRGSIMERLMDFAFAKPDFRRTGKGNHRHKLGDIVMLMILTGMSGQTGRADMIEFGKHNLRKLQSMHMLINGVPSESTLCRIENGIDSAGLARQMDEFSTNRIG